MWSSLKSDWAELVSTVQEDTGVVLERVEATAAQHKRAAAAREVERRLRLPETYTVPLLCEEEEIETASDAAKPNTKKKKAPAPEGDAAGSTESHGAATADGDDDDDDTVGNEQQDREEVARIEAFLRDFDVEARTADISDLLDRHPDALRPHFERLVPAEISYADFWRRFFYRCDVDRIAADWDRDEERARVQRAQLVGRVTTALGGAAKAVATGVAHALTEDDEGRAGQAPSVAVAALRRARPPFVLNTAVDEDDDDDEEEELGWDDDDEDEDDGNEYLSSSGVASGISSSNVSKDDDDDDEEETVEFKDEPLERAREQLKQAIEERDQLHQTVELQKQELVHLKQQQQQQRANESGGEGGGGAPLDEVEQLRAQLKQKEAELEAALLKSAAKETANDKDAAPAPANLQLRNAFSEKEAAVTKLEAAQQEWKRTLAALQAENAALKRTATERQEERAAMLEQNSTLRSELQAARARLVGAEDSVATLRKDLDAAKEEALRRASEGEGEGRSGETPSTVSTGVVKVDKPAAVSKIANADDDDEGWGDDWD